MRRAIVTVAVLLLLLLAACSEDGSTSTTYPWTPTAAESGAVGAARDMDAQAARVWTPYSDGLLLHYIYDFCAGLESANDVVAFLDDRAEEQGEAVLLPLVVGSPYLCPTRSSVVGDWISARAAQAPGG